MMNNPYRLLDVNLLLALVSALAGLYNARTGSLSGAVFFAGLASMNVFFFLEHLRLLKIEDQIQEKFGHIE